MPLVRRVVRVLAVHRALVLLWAVTTAVIWVDVAFVGGIWEPVLAVAASGAASLAAFRCTRRLRWAQVLTARSVYRAGAAVGVVLSGAGETPLLMCLPMLDPGAGFQLMAPCGVCRGRLVLVPVSVNSEVSAGRVRPSCPGCIAAAATGHPGSVFEVPPFHTEYLLRRGLLSRADALVTDMNRARPTPAKSKNV